MTDDVTFRVELEAYDQRVRATFSWARLTLNELLDKWDEMKAGLLAEEFRSQLTYEIGRNVTELVSTGRPAKDPLLIVALGFLFLSDDPPEHEYLTRLRNGIGAYFDVRIWQARDPAEGTTVAAFGCRWSSEPTVTAPPTARVN